MMLCYVMLCYVVLCDVMFCYVTLCYVMLCYVMLCYVMLCHAMLCYAMLCYVMLCYVNLCYVMFCYIMLCYYNGARKSSDWLDKWKSSKLGTGSRIQSFLRAFPSPTEVSVLLVSQPNIVWLYKGRYFCFLTGGNFVPKDFVLLERLSIAFTENGKREIQVDKFSK